MLLDTYNIDGREIDVYGVSEDDSDHGPPFSHFDLYEGPNCINEGEPLYLEDLDVDDGTVECVDIGATMPSPDGVESFLREIGEL